MMYDYIIKIINYKIDEESAKTIKIEKNASNQL